MSATRKKKRGRKPLRSTLSREQRQAKICKTFKALKKKQLREALSDKRHVAMVVSDGNYVWVYYHNQPCRRYYGTFAYAAWLLPDFYFRTVNKGVRVNLLYFTGFREKEPWVWMQFSGHEDVLLDRDHAKNLQCLKDILLQPRYLQAKKNI